MLGFALLARLTFATSAAAMPAHNGKVIVRLASDVSRKVAAETYPVGA